MKFKAFCVLKKILQCEVWPSVIVFMICTY